LVALGAPGAADDDPVRVAVGVALRLPTVPQLSSPAQGAEVEGPLIVAGSADPDSSITLAIDGAFVAQVPSAADGAFALSIPLSVVAGKHALEVTASDNAGNVSPPANADFEYVVGGRARGGCATSTSAGSACLCLLLWFCARRRRGLPAVSLVVGAAILAATRVNAAAPEVNLGLFRPATGGDGYAGVEGARPLAAGEGLEVRFWLDGATKTLVYLPGAGGEQTVLRNRVGGWFVAQGHVWRGLSLAIELPATLNQSGDLTNLPPSQRGPTRTPAGLGDIRVSPRLSLLRQEDAGIDLAAQISLELPTARAQSFTGDGRAAGEALLALGHRWDGPGLSVIELLGNVYGRLRPPRQVIEVKTGNEAGARLGAGFFPGLQNRFVPHRLYAEVEMQSFLRAGGSGGATPAEWRSGLGFCIGRAVSLDLAAGGAIGNGIGAPLARFITAIGFSPQSCAGRVPASMADRDGDGLADATDLCPDQPGPPENKGCPLVVAQVQPACPPPAAAVAPPAQEPVKVAEAPKSPEPDRDRDGVPDKDDSCPDLPGPATNYGCPVTIKQLVVIRNERIEILDRVYFQTGKAALQRRSFPLLDQVAFLLKGHAELQTVQVEGHTDNTGAAVKNLSLSQARAEAVVVHLIKKGVEPPRLRARGFGSAKPVADNTVRDGREKNRRVEFMVLEYSHEPIRPGN
ncbi:MAG: OmpA family protein, partial [Deltaproteobacteria bacterium]